MIVSNDLTITSESHGLAQESSMTLERIPSSTAPSSSWKFPLLYLISILFSVIKSLIPGV